MKRHRRYVLAAVIAVTFLINLIAWKSTAFCDFYLLHIYPTLGGLYARATGWIPFSVGEWMIVAGLIITAAAVLLGFAAVFFFLFYGKEVKQSRVASLWKFIYKYLSFYSWTLAGVFVVMTLNCFIPFHGSLLEEKYDINSSLMEENIVLKNLGNKQYTFAELTRLRNYVVMKTNQLALEVERDENGDIIYPDNMEELAVSSMQELAKEWPQLRGYYPKPKQIFMSGFLSQQSMKGYFFPFSMEANYNSLMHPVNRPATICHEFAHLKGFMFEDEANMIGFLACINSEDVTFRYSGYLSILNYVNNQFYDALGNDLEAYNTYLKISPLVKAENIFLEQETWEKVEQKAIIDTEVIGMVSDKFTETALVMNGVEDGMTSYSRVVGLLLKYYDGSEELIQTVPEEDFLVQSE